MGAGRARTQKSARASDDCAQTSSRPVAQTRDVGLPEGDGHRVGREVLLPLEGLLGGAVVGAKVTPQRGSYCSLTMRALCADAVGVRVEPRRAEGVVTPSVLVVECLTRWKTS